VPYRPTPLTESKAADARERIVRAALDQLAEGGYASAGVAIVARRAGVATGSVYRHFPSKADLFAEVFRRAAQREVDAVAAAEDVASAVEVFVRRAFRAPARAYALIAEPVDPAVEAERLRFRRAYADIFAALIGDEEGIVSAALVGALAEALVGPLARRDVGEDALVTTLKDFCLSAIGSTHV
jgi:AcrR family transcriptional regulator